MWRVAVAFLSIAPTLSLGPMATAGTVPRDTPEEVIIQTIKQLVEYETSCCSPEDMRRGCFGGPAGNAGDPHKPRAPLRGEDKQ